MNRIPFMFAALSLAALTGCSQNASVTSDAPIAKKVPHEMTIHGDTRTDNYYWLRDDERKAPEVIGYLEAENKYTDAMLLLAT